LPVESCLIRLTVPGMADDPAVLFRAGRSWITILGGVAVAVLGLVAGFQLVKPLEIAGALGVAAIGWWIARSGARRDELRLDGGCLVVAYQVATVPFERRLPLAGLASVEVERGRVRLVASDGARRLLPVEPGDAAETVAAAIRAVLPPATPTPAT
jgi:hypothetical protein